MRISRTSPVLAALIGLSGPALAQPADDPPETLDPAPALPPLPPADADLRGDLKQFEEVQTEPEVLAGQPVGAVERKPLMYERLPALSYTAQAVAGVLASGVVGLAGASLGGAIDEADALQPIGGLHGPAVGGFTGTLVGSALGVWAGSALFEKDTHPGWIGLGSAAGTLVGTGAAYGVAALGSNDATTGATMVAGMLIFQIGGAILFGELFAPPPTARAPSDRGLIVPPDLD